MRISTMIMCSSGFAAANPYVGLEILCVSELATSAPYRKALALMAWSATFILLLAFSGTPASASDGVLRVDEASGGVIYSYPISNQTIDGHNLNVTLNWVGSARATAFTAYLATQDSCSNCDEWEVFSRSRGIWTVGVNGFALNTLHSAHSFRSDPTTQEPGGLTRSNFDDRSFTWLVEGYDYCNRMFRMNTDHDQDVIRLLRSGGGVVELRNGKRWQDVGSQHHADLYTGHYYINSINTRGFALVEFDSTTNWPSSVNAYAPASYPERYAFVPRVVYYYPGDGLEYVFREHVYPYGLEPFEDADERWALPTIFYLEEINSQLRRLTTFARTRHNGDGSRWDDEPGRAQITEFAGHRLTFDDYSATFEALDRALTIDYKVRVSGLAFNDIATNELIDAETSGVLDYPLFLETGASGNLSYYSSFGFVTAIRDPEGRTVELDYEKTERTYSDFDLPVKYGWASEITLHTAQHRLKTLTQPAARLELAYYAGDGVIEQDSMAYAERNLLYDLHDVASSLEKYAPDNTLLARTEYEYNEDPYSDGFPAADEFRTSLIRTIDKVSLDTTTRESFYTLPTTAPYWANPDQESQAPDLISLRRDSVIATAGDMTTTVVRVTQQDPPGASRFVTVVTTATTYVQQGSGPRITTAQIAYDYEFEHIHFFDGDGALSGHFGEAPQKRTTYALHPQNPGDTLRRDYTIYKHQGWWSTGVTRLDSTFDALAGKRRTAELYEQGYTDTTALIFTTEQLTNSSKRVPPQYLLPWQMWSEDGDGNYLGGRILTYGTDYTGQGNHDKRYGALISDSVVSAGATDTVAVAVIDYRAGWYRNLPVAATNTLGARSRVFYDHANATELDGSYPTGEELRNDNSIVTNTLSRELHEYELPAAAHQYIRKYDASGSLVTDTLRTYFERSYFGQLSGMVDANGWYWETEYDANGRPLVVRHPYDFPPGYDAGERERDLECTRLGRFATGSIERFDTLKTGSEYITVGTSDTLANDSTRLMASRMINSLGARRDSSEQVVTHTLERSAHLTYRSHADDGIHQLSNISDLYLRLFVTNLRDNRCITFLVDFAKFGYTQRFTFDCPPAELIEGSSTTPANPQELRVPMLPIVDSLRAMSTGQELEIAIRMQSADGAVEFASFADQLMPCIVAIGDPPVAFHKDYTFRYTYDDEAFTTEYSAKIDDDLHTADAGWSATYGSHDGRYTGAKSYYGADYRTLKTEAFIGSPAAPTRIDSVLVAQSGLMMNREVTGPTGDVTKSLQNAVGHIDTLIHADGEEIVFSYAMNTPAHFGFTNTSDQDFGGMCLAVVAKDEEGRKQARYYDIFQRLRRTVADSASLKLTTRFNYDDQGRLTEVVNPKGDTTKYWYDGFNRVRYKYQPDLGYVSYAYDHAGNVRFSQTEAQSTTNQLTFRQYDDAGRMTLVGEAQTLPAIISMPGFSLDRLTDELDPNVLHDNGASAILTANKTLWQTTTATIPSFWTSQTTTACLPSAVPDYAEETAPVGPYLKHTASYYEPVPWASAPKHAFEHVALYPEHVRSVVNYDALPPSTGAVWKYFPVQARWDSLAPTGSVRNLRGRGAAVAYRDHSGEPYHYAVTSYDERGRIEALLRFTENLGFDAVYYSYNSANRIRRMTVADPLRQYTAWYSYDDNGRIDSVFTLLSDVGSGIGADVTAPKYPSSAVRPTTADLVYAYATRGNVETVKYVPENIITMLAYNKRGWLDSLKSTRNGNLFFTELLEHDLSGWITKQTSQHTGQGSARVQDYEYDGAVRLTGWTLDGGKTTYSYDAAGNRTQMKYIPTGTQTNYTLGATHPNQLTNVSVVGQGSTRYTYDNDGAVMRIETFGSGSALQSTERFEYSGGLVRKYTKALTLMPPYYCPDHESPSYDANKWDWRYRYGPSGAREQKRLYASPHGDRCDRSHLWVYYATGAGGEQLAVYNGRQTADVDACSNTGRRVHMYATEYLTYGALDGAELVTRPDGSKEYRVADHLGNVRSVAGASGATLAQYDYKPFGGLIQVGSTTQAGRRGWIDSEQDQESALFDLGFRKHDDGIGRFLSIDPLWETQPGHTPYHYAYNNPINGKDPSGLFTAMPSLPGSSLEIEVYELDDPLMAGGVTAKRVKWNTEKWMQNARAYAEGVSRFQEAQIASATAQAGQGTRSVGISGSGSGTVTAGRPSAGGVAIIKNNFDSRFSDHVTDVIGTLGTKLETSSLFNNIQSLARLFGVVIRIEQTIGGLPPRGNEDEAFFDPNYHKGPTIFWNPYAAELVANKNGTIALLTTGLLLFHEFVHAYLWLIGEPQGEFDKPEDTELWTTPQEKKIIEQYEPIAAPLFDSDTRDNHTRGIWPVRVSGPSSRTPLSKADAFFFKLWYIRP